MVHAFNPSGPLSVVVAHVSNPRAGQAEEFEASLVYISEN